MAQCKVYGNKPDAGPGMLAAKTAQVDVNKANPTWNVTHKWTEDNTLYSSAVATDSQLVSAFQTEFPNYNVA